jgi:Glutaminase
MPSVTLERAKQLFNLVNGRVCCSASAAAPCIPFVYPDDGCWGRAHEMCRLMIADGASPEKVWIYGSLRVLSQNKPVLADGCPACTVCWGWHVAPTLQVSVGGGVQTYVVDPSLFLEPVPQMMWAGVQGDPSAVLIASPASVFYRNQSGTVIQTDPTYSQTNTVLDTYRNQLKLRVASHGPPPYPACIARPPGTQWIGVIPGNGTQHWFTWGWPAAWHVFWTIMPLTACPGVTQLSWTTQVERATGSQCTHWITVRNLSGDPVTFAGRYDVLST